MNDTPWREVTPDDFKGSTYGQAGKAQKALLRGRDEGGYRLRVVFREAQDLKQGADRDPLWLFNYTFRQPYILWHADEVVIDSQIEEHSVEQAQHPRLLADPARPEDRAALGYDPRLRIRVDEHPRGGLERLAYGWELLARSCSSELRRRPDGKGSALVEFDLHHAGPSGC
jgi:hypothetical protein